MVNLEWVYSTFPWDLTSNSRFMLSLSPQGFKPAKKTPKVYS